MDPRIYPDHRKISCWILGPFQKFGPKHSGMGEESDNENRIILVQGMVVMHAHA